MSRSVLFTQLAELARQTVDSNEITTTKLTFSRSSNTVGLVRKSSDVQMTGESSMAIINQQSVCNNTTS